jgi:hypothetical protein
LSRTGQLMLFWRTKEGESAQKLGDMHQTCLGALSRAAHELHAERFNPLISLDCHCYPLWGQTESVHGKLPVAFVSRRTHAIPPAKPIVNGRISLELLMAKMLAPAMRRHAVGLLQRLGQMTLAGKAAGFGDLADGNVGAAQQLLGFFQAGLHEPAMRGLAQFLVKTARKMSSTQPRGSGQVVEADLLSEMARDELLDALQPPLRQSHRHIRLKLGSGPDQQLRKDRHQQSIRQIFVRSLAPRGTLP